MPTKMDSGWRKLKKCWYDQTYYTLNHIEYGCSSRSFINSVSSGSVNIEHIDLLFSFRLGVLENALRVSVNKDTKIFLVCWTTQKIINEYKDWNYGPPHIENDINGAKLVVISPDGYFELINRQLDQHFSSPPEVFIDIIDCAAKQ